MYYDTTYSGVFFMRKKKLLKTTNGGHKKRGVPSKMELYALIGYRGDELIKRLFELTKSDNESVAVSASRTLLERVLPALTTTELKGDGQGIIQLFVNMGSGFVPTSIQLPTSPTRGITTGQPPLQSTGLAQES